MSDSRLPARRSTHLRRGLLAATVALAAAAVVTPSCSTPFDPPSLVNALRVLAVEADAPYAAPGETVTLSMKYVDGRKDLESRPPIQITWIGGCFNPAGDSYFNCYEPLGRLFEAVANGEVAPTDFALQGPGFDTFSITFPEDALSSRVAPAYGPKLATAFVFFAACAGELRPVEDAGDTEAEAFPFGCFDVDTGERLGPDAFVPGYTVLYAYDDGRRNAAPEPTAFVIDGEEIGVGEVPEVEACAVSEEERAQAGCAATDEFTACTTYEIDLAIPRDVAEIDPDSIGIDGEPLDEVVWINYYADAGDFDGAVRLVNDADQGYQEEHFTVWVPPEEPGRYSLWAVVRDSRGGSSTVQRFVDVK